MSGTSDVIVIGAGIIGAATAYFASLQGLSVTVVERGLPASGTTSRCEGNILVSDKERGPELELMQYSLDVWKGELAEFGHLWEFESKGGIIVASRESSLRSLERVTASQRMHGIVAEQLDSAALRELEPNVTDSALGAAYYPEDSQVQPILAASHLLRLARERGAKLVTNAPVTELIRGGGGGERTHGPTRDGTRVTGVRTPQGDFFADHVVNTTGTWAPEIASLAGVNVPVNPRRGYVLVTEQLPPMVHHKVYAAEYIDNVGSGDASLQSSPVVEGTPAGTILIGSSRERIGFDSSVSVDALRQIAQNAIELFPFLERTRILRHYHGFRPFCPDHLPVIGHDPRAPGLWHASGHEGAGIGLSVGTGKLLGQALAGIEPEMPLTPFRPERFDEPGAPDPHHDSNTDEEVAA
ncbi:NAD(P)/FAD-dependent oxidoreductase [Leucobacter denitrificans]|uniref:FAD-binding oxidoreductase n=1 Tax=Leucobacter denitrificans TaxID=683042 RepID=A0A7G9S3M6_9MICO|nr:FAD-dependent oxidoreductase [Leucobacter denitrificans]QNN62451.1 FAD-binding oxidoreductase [Leucobacter denitrificans]